MKKAYWGTLAFTLVYLAAAVVCLRQWNGSDPWARLDVFSGTYLVLSIFWTAASMGFLRVVFRSREMMREAAGVSYDPGFVRWIAVLALGGIAVFLDYGQWRLTPTLEIPALQWLGLALYCADVFWLYWVDSTLSRHFSSGLTARRVMIDGPYRFVRHPRYTAILFSGIAFALVFASFLAWALFFVWLVLILRRIRREDYDAYAAHTARLLPGVF
jgi:protein-S-isoprenylcysteine O-methyltransferase Ste14